MQVHTLDDGTAVWLDPMRDVRSVALGVYVKGGSADEEPSRLGATHFLEHLLFKRSRRRGGAAIARMTDRLGGDCDAYTTKESVAFHARTPAERLPDALSLLLDLTESPVFTADDVDVERGVILEEMAEADDVPEDRLHDALVRKLWPDHPLGAPILGTAETVRALDRRALAARFREIFRPERTALVAVGAFEAEPFLSLVARLRSRRAKPAPAAAPKASARRRAPRPRRCTIHLPRPELNQTHLLVGAPAPTYGDPSVPAAWVATIVLGGGVSSRLWRDVRERKGLAYHVGSGLTLHRDAGLSLIEAATAPPNLPKLVKTTGRVLSELRRTGVTRGELVRAKDQMKAEIALALESTASRREAAARDWLYRGRPRDVEEVIARIDAVTPSQVEEAIGVLFSAGRPLGLGVTGPSLGGASVDELAEQLAA